MTIRKYDSSILGYMSLFKKITKVNAKDCLVIDGSLIFFTNPGQAGLAVGKAGKNIKSLKTSLNKDIKIAEWSDDPSKLISNLIFPLIPESVELSEDGSTINIKFKSSKERRILLADNQKKLKDLKEIIIKYFPNIKSIIVLQ